VFYDFKKLGLQIYKNTYKSGKIHLLKLGIVLANIVRQAHKGQLLM
jgi:hypothetical protein